MYLLFVELVQLTHDRLASVDTTLSLCVPKNVKFLDMRKQANEKTYRN